MQRIKLALLIVVMLAGVGSYAQTPEKKSKAVVFKFTETWCGPCGDWGWETAEETISQLGDKGYYIGVMGSSTPASMDANCYDAFTANYEIDGYPTFMVKEDNSSFTSGQVMALVNAFAATTAVASPAAKFSITGSTLNVTAKAKFWAATTGEYYMTAFLVEDSVLATQNGKTGIVAHHHIMRGTMSTNLSPWGEMIATGNVTNNAEFTKTYSIAINPEWKKEHLEVIMVLFKKNGTTYEFVNSSKGTTAATTAIENIAGVSSVNLYPNPSNGITNLQIALSQSMTISVNVTDPLGRIVYKSENNKLNAGNNVLSIPSQNFSNGAYMVSIINGAGQMNTQRLIIVK